MATIGNLHEDQHGFTGSIQTVGLKAKVAITPVEKARRNRSRLPGVRRKVEIGAGWARTSKGGREFVSLKPTTRASPLRSTLT